jgi:hypothetical protein
MSSFLTKFPLSRIAALSMTMAALSLGACDSVKPTKAREEELTLYDFSSAMRWGDFDKAYDYVDPKTKKDHPMTDIDRGRFKQVEISGYEVTAKAEQDGVIDQEVKLDLINRNTQIPRSVVYHEHWKWDAVANKWWLTTGMPDISPQN